jgi:hypothetical protein
VGWAADLDRRRPADAVLAFSGRRLAGVALPGAERPDIAEAYGRQLRRSGYILRLDASVDDATRLRVVAVSGDRGSELKKDVDD